jgi:hypothetical protein
MGCMSRNNLTSLTKANTDIWNIWFQFLWKIQDNNINFSAVEKSSWYTLYWKPSSKWRLLNHAGCADAASYIRDERYISNSDLISDTKKSPLPVIRYLKYSLFHYWSRGLLSHGYTQCNRSDISMACAAVRVAKLTTENCDWGKHHIAVLSCHRGMKHNSHPTKHIFKWSAQARGWTQNN